jgi:hypothetical protein
LASWLNPNCFERIHSPPIETAANVRSHFL